MTEELSFLVPNAIRNFTVFSASSNGIFLPTTLFLRYFVLLKNFALSLSLGYRYPHLSEEEIAENCPFCRGNCNCNLCLHSSGMIKVASVLSHQKSYLSILFVDIF